MFWRMQSHYVFGGYYLKAENADKGGSALHIKRTTRNNFLKRSRTLNKYFIENKHKRLLNTWRDSQPHSWRKKC